MPDTVDPRDAVNCLDDHEAVTAHLLDRIGTVVVGTLMPYDGTTERLMDSAGQVQAVVASSVRSIPAYPEPAPVPQQGDRVLVTFVDNGRTSEELVGQGGTYPSHPCVVRGEATVKVLVPFSETPMGQHYVYRDGYLYRKESLND